MVSCFLSNDAKYDLRLGSSLTCRVFYTIHDIKIHIAYHSLSALLFWLPTSSREFLRGTTSKRDGWDGWKWSSITLFTPHHVLSQHGGWAFHCQGSTWANGGCSMVIASTFMMRPQAFFGCFCLRSWRLLACCAILINIVQSKGPRKIRLTSIHLVEFGRQTVSESICMGWVLKGF